MRHIRRLLAVSFIILCSYQASAADTPGICESFAHTMIQQAMDIFHDTAAAEQKRASLAALFQKAVDMDWIGKFVLGRYWKTADANEQRQYLQLYHTYLTNSYVFKFDDEDSLRVEGIKISSLIPTEPNLFEAKTLIQRKGEEDTHVDYLLDQSSRECRIHDISVEGVSLITTQRSEFQSLASSSGVKGVIEAMQKQLSAQ